MSIDSSVYDAYSVTSSMNCNNINLQKKNQKINGSVCSLQLRDEGVENYEDNDSLRLKPNLLQYLYISRYEQDQRKAGVTIPPFETNIDSKLNLHLR